MAIVECPPMADYRRSTTDQNKLDNHRHNYDYNALNNNKPIDIFKTAKSTYLWGLQGMSIHMSVYCI
jgi:hypothetical protein